MLGGKASIDRHSVQKDGPMATQRRFSALFLSHGAPNILLGDSPAALFLRTLGSFIEKPERIIIVSAHWQTALPTIGAASIFKTIHDFSGFEDALYRILYPARGAPEEAQRLQENLKNVGVPCQLDSERGLDHGSWVPLIALYPDGDIPVIPISLPKVFAPDDLMQMGTFLRESFPDKTLLIGSGGSTHNLYTYRPERSPYPETVAFDAWLKSNLLTKNTAALLDFHTVAPEANFNHPTDEHFLPLIVAMGFGYDTPGPVLLHEEISGGSLSLASYGFPRPDQAEEPVPGSGETGANESSRGTGSFPLSE